MIYELAKTEDLQTVYDVVQHTIKTIYPKYYPKEVVDFVYHHMNRYMMIKTGKCHSVPTVMENGKIKLLEQWEWTSGDFSKGESLLVEV